MIKFSIYMSMVFLLFLQGCCTKVDCICPALEIKIYSKFVNYKLYRTDKNFTIINNQKMNFLPVKDKAGYYTDEVSDRSFSFDASESLSDFNYILENLDTHDRDTISDISYDAEEYSFVCNSCAFGDDMKKCNNILNKKLRLNGVLIEGFEIDIE
jgi:hypothetical protein